MPRAERKNQGRRPSSLRSKSPRVLHGDSSLFPLFGRNRNFHWRLHRCRGGLLQQKRDSQCAACERIVQSRRVHACVKELGFKGQDLVLRSDQKLATKDLQLERWPEEIPSHNVVDSGIQTVQDQICVLKDALEPRQREHRQHASVEGRVRWYSGEPT